MRLNSNDMSNLSRYAQSQGASGHVHQGSHHHASGHSQASSHQSGHQGSVHHAGHAGHASHANRTSHSQQSEQNESGSHHHSTNEHDSVDLSHSARHGGGHSQAGTGHHQYAAGSGYAALHQAQQFLGHSAQSVSGHLANYHAAGGQTNDCADFVSALEQNSGRLHSHSNTVAGLRQNLVHEGWKPVSKGQAGVGDVAIYGNQHTEMVANQGASRLIGANGSGQESVSYTGSWGSPTYYHRS